MNQLACIPLVNQIECRNLVQEREQTESSNLARESVGAAVVGHWIILEHFIDMCGC